MTGLVTFIDFAFATQCAALDYVDTQVMGDLSKDIGSYRRKTLKFVQLAMQVFFIKKKHAKVQKN